MESVWSRTAYRVICSQGRRGAICYVLVLSKPAGDGEGLGSRSVNVVPTFCYIRAIVTYYV